MSDINLSLAPRNVRIAIRLSWVFVGLAAILALLPMVLLPSADHGRKMFVVLFLFVLLFAILSGCVYALSKRKRWAFVLAVSFCGREIFRYFFYHINHRTSVWGVLGGIEVLLCFCILILLVSSKSLAWYFSGLSR
jgi:hypothetical protein